MDNHENEEHEVPKEATQTNEPEISLPDISAIKARESARLKRSEQRRNEEEESDKEKLAQVRRMMEPLNPGVVPLRRPETDLPPFLKKKSGPTPVRETQKQNPFQSFLRKIFGGNK